MSEPAPFPRLYLDTNVFIYAVQGDPDVAAPLHAFLRETLNFAHRPVTSELTLAEVLCKQGLGPDIRSLFMNLIVDSQLIDVRPITRDVLLGSAELRRKSPRYRLPDAIHASTAFDARCTFLMTNDERFGKLPKGVTTVKPDVNGIQHVLGALNV